MCILYIYIHTFVGVSNLGRTGITYTTITVKWDPAITPSDCGPVFYNVTATNLADASDRNTIVWGLRAEFSNLMNGTNYTISVAAVNRAGSGPSSMITVTTLTGNEGKIILLNVHNSVDVFLIRSYGAPNGSGRCSVAQCYDKTCATLAQSKMDWYH